MLTTKQGWAMFCEKMCVICFCRSDKFDLDGTMNLVLPVFACFLCPGVRCLPPRTLRVCTRVHAAPPPVLSA